MAWAEHTGKMPKGSFKKWKAHTHNIKSLPEKVGSVHALLDLGLYKLAEEMDFKQTGKETRLKKNHEPFDFYNTRRTFERAASHKKEVGIHAPLHKNTNSD